MANMPRYERSHLLWDLGLELWGLEDLEAVQEARRDCSFPKVGAYQSYKGSQSEKRTNYVRAYSPVQAPL